MNFAPTYLIGRSFYRLALFFRHWYAGGSRYLFHSFTGFLEGLDQIFAVRLTARYFFHPLYKDYSVVGRVLGIIFRSGRILLGISIYLIVAILFLLIYLAWLLIPPVLILVVFGTSARP